MNILMIGNGFDLAHGLPTKYGDFLEFCKRVKKIYCFNDTVTVEGFKYNYLKNWKIDNSIKEVLLDACVNRDYKKGSNGIKVVTTYQELNELYSHIKDNIWIEYFLKYSTFYGENWIDFEQEISKVIQSLDVAMIMYKHGKKFEDIPEKESGVLINISKVYTKGGIQKIYKGIAALNKFTALLEVELARLIRALEIYIAGFVGSIPVTKTDVDIKKLNPDCVLSFNYSNTYERIYDRNKIIKFDYIHGKADTRKNLDSCNLVLGINEYLSNDRKDKDLEFLPFKKYYQRIYKSTGNEYLNWIDKIKDEYAKYISSGAILTSKEYQKHTLYIFGHSLDVTDKDVLKLFICNENIQTKIFYHRKNKDDKAELGKLIRNLILLIGQDELKRRTGGAHKTIEFVPQTLPNRRSILFDVSIVNIENGQTRPNRNTNLG